MSRLGLGHLVDQQVGVEEGVHELGQGDGPMKQGCAPRKTITEPELADTTYTESATESTGTCAVCDQPEAPVSEYLSPCQFRLATSEHHQTRYTAIGSPVGISAGYATLTESLADMLDSVDHQSSTIAELAQSVIDLARRPEKCPVCAALTATEHGAVAEIASATVAHTTLCLRHVALVLAADPAPDDGRVMLRALATALRRDSQDMRAYALKREALHSELITDEESRAYLAALQLLAGRPELVQPWGRITG